MLTPSPMLGEFEQIPFDHFRGWIPKKSQALSKSHILFVEGCAGSPGYPRSAVSPERHVRPRRNAGALDAHRKQFLNHVSSSPKNKPPMK